MGRLKYDVRAYVEFTATGGQPRSNYGVGALEAIGTRQFLNSECNPNLRKDLFEGFQHWSSYTALTERLNLQLHFMKGIGKQDETKIR